MVDKAAARLLQAAARVQWCCTTMSSPLVESGEDPYAWDGLEPVFHEACHAVTLDPGYDPARVTRTCTCTWREARRGGSTSEIMGSGTSC